MSTPVVEGVGLGQTYTIKRGPFRAPARLQAVGGVSFAVEAGRTLAVVGESGCGKSTLARMVTLIEKPTQGTLRLQGVDAVQAGAVQKRELRRAVQLVFQNPFGSLNPRKKIGSILEAPLVINTAQPAAEREQRARAMLAKVGLRPEHYGRYPHMFSGGQRQRIAIARALMLRPKVLVLDEPVSALDVSIRAQVLNLLVDLQQEFGLAYVFISHDLSVVRHVADDVLVMYLGRTVEHATRAALFAQPQHPYTRALLSATPVADPSARLAHAARRIILRGELPSPFAPPPGCAFAPRCPIAMAACREAVPALLPVDPGSPDPSQRFACIAPAQRRLDTSTWGA